MVGVELGSGVGVMVGVDVAVGGGEVSVIVEVGGALAVGGLTVEVCVAAGSGVGVDSGVQFVLPSTRKPSTSRR
jgi:hypothetical protein